MTLGSYQAWQTQGTGRQLAEVKDEFMYVPILEVLERMLQNNRFFEEVTRPLFVFHYQTAITEVYHYCFVGHVWTQEK